MDGLRLKMTPFAVNTRPEVPHFALVT
jgi:hypothetical protein